MSERELPPLDTNLWFECLERLGQAVREPGGRIENRLRQLYYLSNLAPPPFAALVGCELEEAAFEALLAQAAFESAALSLVGAGLSFEIARTMPGPEVSARVWDGDTLGEARAASDCVAYAIVQAWIEFLLQLRERKAELVPLTRPKGRRRSRSGPLPKPIAH